MTDLLIFLYISIKLPPDHLYCQNKKRQAWFISSSPLMITVGPVYRVFLPLPHGLSATHCQGFDEEIFFSLILIPASLLPSRLIFFHHRSIRSLPISWSPPAVSARSMSPVHSSALCLTAACWNFLCKTYSHTYLTIGPLLFCHNPWKKVAFITQKDSSLSTWVFRAEDGTWTHTM